MSLFLFGIIELYGIPTLILISLNYHFIAEGFLDCYLPFKAIELRILSYFNCQLNFYLIMRTIEVYVLAIHLHH